MSERWQQWMPFHIDRFRGSPDVIAMPLEARIGYLYLLASSWQTDDCSIPNDPIALASLSGLGDELWDIHGVRILRKFSQTVAGRLANTVLRSEWEEAKRIFGQKQAAREEISRVRSEAGRRGNEKRWSYNRKPVARPSQDHRKTIANDRLTGTGTGTGTLKTTTPATAGFELPDWIDGEIWDGYLEVRVSKRASKSPRAWNAVLKQLSTFRARGHDPNAILETSIRSNWTDVYEPKGATNGAYRAGKNKYEIFAESSTGQHEAGDSPDV